MELKSRSFTSKEPHVAREPQVADPWPRLSQPYCVLHTTPGSATGRHFSKGLAGYNIWQCSAIFKKYLQCVLAARILIVDEVSNSFSVHDNTMATVARWPR
jgi:hypothetical protein